MASEEDAGRDSKVLLGMVALGVLGGGMLVYLAWSWLTAPPPQPSQVDLNRVAQAPQGGGSESAAYRELLQKYNYDGGQRARDADSSFIASIPMEQVIPVVPTTQAKPAAPQPAAQPAEERKKGESSEEEEKRAEKRRQALEKLLARMYPENEAPRTLQVATVLGGGEASADGRPGAAGNSGGSNQGAGYQRWSESLPGGAVARRAGDSRADADISLPPIEVIPPYWRGPGVISVGVDSDNSTTPVLANLPTGRFAGAVLKAPDGARLAGDGVVIHFTQMAFGGVNYNVDAYALKDDTLLANIATEVDHRYMSRIVLPALLSGIGSVGQLYSQANTQVVSNGFSTQVVRPGLPDGQAVAGTIAGGTASQAAKVLSDDAAKVPPTQVKVRAGEVVAIQFMRGVYAGDAIRPGQGGENVRPAVAPAAEAIRPAAGDMQPAARWRTQAQTQIDEQQRLLETR